MAHFPLLCTRVVKAGYRPGRSSCGGRLDELVMYIACYYFSSYCLFPFLSKYVNENLGNKT